MVKHYNDWILSERQYFDMWVKLLSEIFEAVCESPTVAMVRNGSPLKDIYNSFSSNYMYNNDLSVSHPENPD